MSQCQCLQGRFESLVASSHSTRGHCWDGESSRMPGEGIHFGLPQLSSVIVSDASGMVLEVLWITVKLETSGSQINSWE